MNGVKWFEYTRKNKKAHHTTNSRRGAVSPTRQEKNTCRNVSRSLPTPAPTCFIEICARRTMRRRVLVFAAVVALVWGSPDADEAARKEAEEAHEKAAQKALTDALTDALAMMRHGSARAKEQAARSIAQLAIETTISQPFHPVTCVPHSAAVKTRASLQDAVRLCSCLTHSVVLALACLCNAGSAMHVCALGSCPSWWVCSPARRQERYQLSQRSRPLRPTTRARIWTMGMLLRRARRAQCRPQCDCCPPQRSRCR